MNNGEEKGKKGTVIFVLYNNLLILNMKSVTKKFNVSH